MNTEQLIEIKKNETGKGLLIENDGYISLSDHRNNLLKESVENFNAGALKELPNPFTIYAVFQKFGIENANGRIYPEEVLKRETNNYIQKINNRTSYGECYTPDVMCLTENGWKILSDVKEGDKVLSLNPETKEIEIATVINKISYQYNDTMLRISGLYINDLVTPNHKFPVFVSKGIFDGFHTANEIRTWNKEYAKDRYLIRTDECGDYVGETISLADGKVTFTEEPYEGLVECIDLDINHTWCVKSNSQCHWTSNCNHPEDSNINLERLAMYINELHWEGSTLIGKLTFPLTPGFRKYGIVSCLADLMAHWIISGMRIGVSSRGVGTVTQQYGKLIVSDDYEIICWDVVSNPSTPNAYIEMESDSLRPYIEETDESNSKKPLIKEEKTNDKFAKFDDWLKK